MYRLGVVGVSWRRGPAAPLAALTIPRDQRRVQLPELARAACLDGLVYLATCNRVEVAFATDGSTPITVLRRRIFAALTGREPRAGESEQLLHLWQAEGAAEHLFLVAAGLDSAQVGENEIAVQVRDAVDESRSLGLLSPHLEHVFSQALKVARRVRPVTDERGGRASIADIALRHVFDRVTETPGPVALVGVSPMIERCGRELALRGIPIVLVNRTVERAMALGSETGATICSLEDFCSDPAAIEALVIATGSADPVLRRADLERIAARTPSGLSPLIVDLAVPPNVAPEAAAAADVPRIGMREITEEAALDRDQRMLELADARAIIDDALTELRREAAERLVAPMIAHLRVRYRRTALEGIERLLARELAGLGEAERDAIRRWAETLARRFAHIPSVGLRDVAFSAGPRAVEAFFERAEPELARELREAVDRSGVELLGHGIDDA